MMFKVTINCDNAAFHEAGAGYEVSRILADLIRKVEDAGDIGKGDKWAMIDSNGNNVGGAVAQ